MFDIYEECDTTSDYEEEKSYLVILVLWTNAQIVHASTVEVVWQAQ